MEPCLVHPFKVKEVPRFTMSDNYAGLLLITYNDKQNLDKCLQSLIKTVDYPTVLYCVDLNSTDGSYEALLEFQSHNSLENEYIKNVCIEQHTFEDLTKTLNRGWEFLMSRQECEYIGWIHPDMTFSPKWESMLVAALEQEQSLGKACAYNTRDRENAIYAEPYPGQEQCYLIKRGVLLQVGLYDEQFVGIGGLEDWDHNRRIIYSGFGVKIIPNAKHCHVGMATRVRRNTVEEQVHNRARYNQKWHDDSAPC